MYQDDPYLPALALFGVVALFSFAAGWLVQGIAGVF